MTKNRKYQKRSRDTVEGFTPVSNPEQAQWMQLMAGSNATQRHVPLPRKGSRAQRKSQALREQRTNQD